MPYEFGDLVLMPFPFTNQAASKQRPAVIVSSRAYNRAKPDIVVMAVTSQLRPNPTLGEVWTCPRQRIGECGTAHPLDPAGDPVARRRALSRCSSIL